MQKEVQREMSRRQGGRGWRGKWRGVWRMEDMVEKAVHLCKARMGKGVVQLCDSGNFRFLLDFSFGVKYLLAFVFRWFLVQVFFC